MKTLQKIVLLLLFITAFTMQSQTKFYTEEGKPIKVIGEKTILSFETTAALAIKDTLIMEDEGFLGGLGAKIIPGVIDTGFKIVGNLIEKNLKKYTNTFSAGNTFVSSDPKKIPGFVLTRQIILKGEKSNKQAFSASFEPKWSEPGKSVFFAVKEIQCSFSGAKVKKGYGYNNYIVELKVNYFDGKKKQTLTLSPITLSLIKISNGNVINNSAETNLYASDKIFITDNFQISEISVKVVETNAAKVNAEKIKELSDNYLKDVQDNIKTIVNYYLEE